MNCITLVLSTFCLSVFAIDIQPPEWGEAYFVKGILFNSYSGIEQPFEAYYDGYSYTSRVDYYDGTVKTYQFRNEGKYGREVQVVQSVDKDLSDFKEKCFIKNATYNIDITKPLLPDCREFNFDGEEDLLGWKCHKFVKSNEYIWVRYVEEDSNYSSPIPVRYEVRSYSHPLHYDFDSFEWHIDFPEDTFEVDRSDCKDVTESDNDQFVTLNPMKEFVDPLESAYVAFEHSRYMKEYGVVYATDEEKRKRLQIFADNYRFIKSKNREPNSFKLGVNHLADRTPNELKKLRGYKPSNVTRTSAFPYKLDKNDLKELPNEFDWRLHGAVTPVKNQGECGSCWAFGAVGAIEGAYFKQTGNLTRLSEQALIDCSWGYSNNGCEGGTVRRVFEFIKEHDGIPTDESYGGYRAQAGLCHYKKKSVEKVAQIKKFFHITNVTKDDMKFAIWEHGPVAVSIDSSPKSFSFYESGIYYEPDCSTEKINHMVLVVGYGVMNDQEYWLIKNSWGLDWGMNGYMLVSAQYNMCGILNQMLFVTEFDDGSAGQAPKSPSGNSGIGSNTFEKGLNKFGKGTFSYKNIKGRSRIARRRVILYTEYKYRSFTYKHNSRNITHASVADY